MKFKDLKEKYPDKVGIVISKIDDKELSVEQRAIYKNVITSLTENFSNAVEYAKKGCEQCRGKGYFDRDNIIPKSKRIVMPINEEIKDDKPYRPTGRPNTKVVGMRTIKFTPTERLLCNCVEKQVEKEVIKL